MPRDAVIPFYVELALGAGGGGLAVLRVLRLVRVFRIFKMGKYSSGAKVVINVVVESMPALSILFFFSLLACVLFAACVYFAEGTYYSVDPDQVSLTDHPRGAYVRPTVDNRGYEVSPFRSIPFGFWWFFTSSTTVGYGDFYPTTDAGKFTAVLCFYMGIILLALPITVIGGNFTTMYRQWVEEMAMTKEIAEAARKNRDAPAVAIAATAPTTVAATA